MAPRPNTGAKLAAILFFAHSRAMAAIVIRVQALTKRYGDVVAVDGIDFEIPRGTTAALLGGNGAGKTTTLAMILGLVLPSAGTVTVLGRNVARERHRVLPRMNFSSPYVELPRQLTVVENLKVFAVLYGLRDVRGAVARVVEDMQIEPYLRRPTGTLSAGQKTRVFLAKALLNRPEVLLLDEPTASLDPEMADWVRGHLERYRRETGATILIASHNMPEVERLCGQAMIMREGRIVDRGPPSELIRRYGRRTLEEVYLDIARGRAGVPKGVAAAG